MTIMQEQRTVHIVDDNSAVRRSLAMLIKSHDINARTYSSAKEFLAEYTEGPNDCALFDVRMPELSGLELKKILNQRGIKLPIIFITGHGDISMAVDAMRIGAVDFIEKPMDSKLLIEKIHNLLERKYKDGQQVNMQPHNELLEKLTPREYEVLSLIVDGKPNKVVADMLSISTRTVEVHRANIMHKLHAQSLVDLVRISLGAQIKSSKKMSSVSGI